MANTSDIAVKKSRLKTPDVQSVAADNSLFNALSVLPNPDPILRKLGKSQQVYDDILADAHVIGELRSLRAGFLSHEWSIQPGGDDAASMRAFELTKRVYSRRPSANTRWPDVIWNVAQAVLRGFSVHQVKWASDSDAWLPSELIAWPTHNFIFSRESELRLRTPSQPNGMELTHGQWLVSRHMPDGGNPYGTALLSTCYWPYVFKHSGWRGFVKFCDKYGLPWAVGRYPAGTDEKDQKALVQSLAAMVEDAVAAVQEGNAIELIEHKHGGEAMHERLISLCNREMSKALVSSTLAIELKGQGSRAATDTHEKRGNKNTRSDREMIADTFNELNEWIALVNVPNATPARYVFSTDVEADPNRIQYINDARMFLDVPQAFAHKFTRIPMAKDGEAVLDRRIDTGQSLAAPGGGGQFNAPIEEGADWQNFSETEIDDAIAAMVEQIRELVETSPTLEALQSALQDIYFDLDSTTLQTALSRALQAGLLEGMNSAAEEAE